MNKLCEYAMEQAQHPVYLQCFRAHHFPHWVWVYGVEENLQDDPENIEAFGWKQKVVKVGFMESGTPFYAGPYADMWPVGLYDNEGNLKINTNLPWMVTYSYSPSTGKMISSTKMIWYWQQYTKYNPTNPQQHPDIYTRYYDGSP